MLNIEPVPLSPDLEWLLQSGQAAPEALAYLLVRDYFTRLQRAAWGWLGNGEAAGAAALSTLVQAVAHPERYRSELGAEAWLFGLLIEECRRQERVLRLEKLLPWMARRKDAAQEETFNFWEKLKVSSRSLPAEARQAHALVRLGGLPVEQAAAWLARPFDAFSRTLALADELAPPFLPPYELDEEAQARLAQEVAAQAGAGTRRTRRVAGLRELGLVALIGLCLLGFLRWSPALMPDPTPTPRPVVTRVKQEIIYVTPTPQVIGGGLVSPEQDAPFLRYHVRPGETLETAALALGVSVDDLLAWNPELGGTSGARLENLTGQALRFDYKSGQAPQVDLMLSPSAYLTQRTPLNAASTSEEIRARLVESANLWSTLWADYVIIFYGPEGYVGPIDLQRQQIWISQPGERSLVIEGSPGGTAQTATLTMSNDQYGIDLESGRSAQAPADWSSVSAQMNGLIFPDASGWSAPGGTFYNRGIASQAGREALLVDWLPYAGANPTRLWIDALTGIVLRVHAADRADHEHVQYEIYALAIKVDPLLPLSAFWLRSNDPPMFYVDAQRSLPTLLSSVYSPVEVTPRPALEPQAAPPDFYPEAARLAFDFSRYATLDELIAAAPLVTGQVFARLPDASDGVFLFNVEMGSPFQLWCARSPDGSRIAWIDAMDAINARGTPLRWADLRTGEVHAGSQNIFPGQFAFSPIRNLLAMYYRSSGHGAVAVIDLENESLKALYAADNARSLVWSSDEEYLAYLTGDADGTTERLVVVSLYDGQVLDKGVVAPSPDDLAWAEAQLGNGVTFPVETFPVEMGGLGACVEPPQ